MSAQVSGSAADATRVRGISRSRIERLLERWRPYDSRRLTRRELRIEAASAATFVVAAAATALLMPLSRDFEPLLALALVVSLALASKVPLHLGAGSAMPTQLVLVPMLFLLPPEVVPACVGLGLAGAAMLDALWRREHAERILTGIADAWHAVAPSLVFVAAGAPAAELSYWAIPLLAVVAQCATDLLFVTAREWLGRGIAPAAQLRVVLTVYALDFCLTPVGFVVAMAAAGQPFAFILALPLLALLAAVAGDRRRRIREAVDRLDQLTAEHERLDRAIHRIGEAFGSKLDRAATVDIGLRTAVEALGATFGRAELADGRIDHALEPAATAEAVTAAERAAQRTGALRLADHGGWFAMAHPLTGGSGAASTEVLAVVRRGRPFTQQEQALFAYLAQQTAIAIENVALHEQLRRQATLDELTGLSNHRRFQEALNQQLARTRRSGKPTALMLLDLDDFKRLNDAYGHRLGDGVLRTVADVIAGACRAADEPARYGGDELAVILPDTDLEDAWALGESMRRAVESLDLVLEDGTPLPVTVSVGVGAVERDSETGTLIEAADTALFQAKRAGKNRTRSTGWAADSEVVQARARTRFKRLHRAPQSS
jgi:diguanylate cyclase (GGDEF)-like protein